MKAETQPEPLDYARPGLQRRPGRDPIERGLSNGRMAFLLLLVGLPLCPVCIGWPIVLTSFLLAIGAIVDSKKKSIFGWVVVVTPPVLVLAGLLIAAWVKIFGDSR